MSEFKELLGERIVKIMLTKTGDDEIIFYLASCKKARLWHSQDCCESVSIVEIVGDLTDILDSPITVAEEIIHDNETPAGMEIPSESYTWTFYRLGTASGIITIRWLGESNGYYSESVDFNWIK